MSSVEEWVLTKKTCKKCDEIRGEYFIQTHDENQKYDEKWMIFYVFTHQK